VGIQFNLIVDLLLAFHRYTLDSKFEFLEYLLNISIYLYGFHSATGPGSILPLWGHAPIDIFS
jgi:hypothetical protein